MSELRQFQIELETLEGTSLMGKREDIKEGDKKKEKVVQKKERKKLVGHRKRR